MAILRSLTLALRADTTHMETAMRKGANSVRDFGRITRSTSGLMSSFGAELTPAINGVVQNITRLVWQFNHLRQVGGLILGAAGAGLTGAFMILGGTIRAVNDDLDETIKRMRDIFEQSERNRERAVKAVPTTERGAEMNRLISEMKKDLQAKQEEFARESTGFWGAVRLARFFEVPIGLGELTAEIDRMQTAIKNEEALAAGQAEVYQTEKARRENFDKLAESIQASTEMYELHLAVYENAQAQNAAAEAAVNSLTDALQEQVDTWDMSGPERYVWTLSKLPGVTEAAMQKARALADRLNELNKGLQLRQWAEGVAEGVKTGVERLKDFRTKLDEARNAFPTIITDKVYEKALGQEFRRLAAGIRPKDAGTAQVIDTSLLSVRGLSMGGDQMLNLMRQEIEQLRRQTGYLGSIAGDGGLQ